MSNKLVKEKKPEPKKKNESLLLVIAGVVILLIAVVVIFGRALGGLGGNGNSGESRTETDGAETGQTADDSAADIPDGVAGPVVTISVKDYGDIVVQLDEQAAPITVENFVTLIKDGFYDGLTFHRIIDGFMIQGGDPDGNGTGGSEKTIKGEFSANGVENPISHKRGVISMARSSDMDSASSQFFIVQSDSTSLDGQYAGFGYVTSGMEIVDQICKDTPVEDSNGTVKAENQPVIEKITVEE